MQAGLATFHFGRFVLDPARRALFAEGEPVTLSSRAFDVLQALVEGRDRVLTKDEIITRVWRGVAVEENNLAVQVSALRRALIEPGAPAMIMTVPGQGYRFVGEVVERVPDVTTPEPGPPAAEKVSDTRGSAPTGPTIVPAQGNSLRHWIIPAAVVALALATTIGWRAAVNPTTPPAPAPRLSIVVLPFRNLSGDPGQDYLADAISDDLTTDLSHLPGSTVIARASSDTFKGHAVAADEIGRALHVRYLLEGSVRGADGMFRINAQLIDAASGAHLWADRFDVGQGRISEAQTNIVRHIASALNLTLVELESARSMNERAGNPDALDLFFRAKSNLNRNDTLAGYTQSQKLLEQAIALQPDFAAALSELGYLLLTKSNNFDDPDDEQDRAEARRMVDQALALQPRHADALVTQAFMFTTEDRYEEAVGSYEAALSIDRNNVRAHAGLGYCEWQLGHPDKAVAPLQEALQLDPVGPNAKWRYQLLGTVQFVQGHYNDAIGLLDRSLAGEPDPKSGGDSLGRTEFTHLFRIAAYDQAGDHVRAKAAFAAYDAIWPHRSVWRLLKYATPAQRALPGFRNFAAGLRNAGMPQFATDAVAPQDAAGAVSTGGDFSPAPERLAGGKTLGIDAFRAASDVADTKILDVGCGGAAIPNAVCVAQSGLEWNAVLDRIIAADRSSGTLQHAHYIVLGTGPYGRDGYLAAQHMLDAGAHDVAWFRGGEEAWVAAGLPSRS